MASIELNFVTLFTLFLVLLAITYAFLVYFGVITAEDFKGVEKKKRKGKRKTKRKGQKR